MRAAPLAPSEWRKRLEAVNNTNNSSHENFNPSCILLDVRNGKYPSFSFLLHFWVYLWGWSDYAMWPTFDAARSKFHPAQSK